MTGQPPDDTSTALDGLERTSYGSFIVARTDDYFIEVLPMLYNYRVVVGLAEMEGKTYEHGYCYFGRGPDTLIKAIAAASAWVDPLNIPPFGYDKQAY